MKNKDLKFNKLLLLAVVPVISTLVSIYQAQFAYDGFHWGLIIFNAKQFIDGKILYKEIFVHYGFLTTIINSIIFKISNNNMLTVFMFYSLSYSIGLFIIGLISYKISKNFVIALLTIFVFFLLHPFTVYPWHSYIIFCLLTIYIYLKFFKKIKYENSILLICSCFNESFIYPAIFIIIFDILYEPIFHRIKIDLNKLKNNLIVILIFLIFISFFLLTNNKYLYWFNYLELPKIFLKEIHQSNIFEMVFNMFYTVFYNGIQRFFFEPQWFFFSVIILTNCFILFYNLLNKNKLNAIYCYISFVSLILLSTNIHNVSIFKISTGLSLGLIVLISISFRIKNFYTRNLILILIFLISLISFEFKKNNSNHLFVRDYQSSEFIKSTKFNYFESQKWSIDTWQHLNLLTFYSKKIQNKCNISLSYNFTKDAFYSLILDDYFEVDQIIPWFQYKERHFMNSFYYSLNKHFDPNLFSRVIQSVNLNNSIVVAYKENYEKIFWGNDYHNFSNKMNFIELQNHDFIKDIIIIYPKNCLI